MIVREGMFCGASANGSFPPIADIPNEESKGSAFRAMLRLVQPVHRLRLPAESQGRPDLADLQERHRPCPSDLMTTGRKDSEAEIYESRWRRLRCAPAGAGRMPLSFAGAEDSIFPLGR